MYYPSSQITPNLYTNGGEYILASNQQPYSGYYWKTSQDRFFTGKNPQDAPIQKLIPINELYTSNIELPNSSYTELYQGSIEVIEYQEINDKIYEPVQVPTYFLTLPTNDDYQIGEFRRYFCKKVNELLYLEINKDTYTKLTNKDSTILYQLYLSFNIPWQLIGDKEQVFKVNKNIVELTSKNLKLARFSDYLQNDFTKYYIETIPYTPSSPTLR